jgi:hypothetical protein
MKKAQLSLFFIIAIVFFAGTLVYLSTTQQESEELTPLEETSLATVPTEFLPVAQYVDACLRQVGKNGLKRVGDHGGYVSVAEAEFRVSSFDIKQPTESDAIQFQGSNLAVPYWWYLKSPNTCTGSCELSSKRPPLTGKGKDSIETQLISYVEASIEECLDNFAGFREQGFSISTPSKPTIKTKIAEENVVMQLTYPLSMQRGDAAFSMDTFSVVFPVQLKHLYELASMITEREMEYRFFERFILELLVSYSDVDPVKLPPMTGLEFELGPGVQWSKRETANKVTGLVVSNSELFRVEGTANFEPFRLQSAFAERIYNTSIIPNNVSVYPSIETSFMYLPDWPMYFDLNCDGDVCQPESASSFMDFMGLQNYRFAYDVSFPIMVELTDVAAFNGEGYTLRFALEANVRNNEPMPAEFFPLSKADAAGEGASLLCDEAQRTSPNITIHASSSFGQPVKNAQVLYTILDNSCFVGQTNMNGALATPLPEGVVGGRVQLISTGYVGNSVEFSPRGVEEAVPLTISPILTKKITVMKKHVLRNSGWLLSDAPQPLAPNEEVMISFTRIPSEGEDDFSRFAQLSGNAEQSIELAPGKYKVDATLMLQDEVVVPASQRCVKSKRKTICQTLPELVLSTGSPPRYNEGGLKITIDIAPEQLASSDKMMLYVLAIDKPAVHEQLAASQNVEGYSNVYRLQLEPKFE